MIDISTLDDQQLVKLIDNRYKKTGTLWTQIEGIYDGNKRAWQNNPEWFE